MSTILKITSAQFYVIFIIYYISYHSNLSNFYLIHYSYDIYVQQLVFSFITYSVILNVCHY